jgi:hypothetical protein
MQKRKLGKQSGSVDDRSRLHGHELWLRSRPQARTTSIDALEVCSLVSPVIRV